MTLTVDEILAAPRAERMRMIRENVDNLSGEDINKITTSLLQGINANLKRTVQEAATPAISDRARLKLKDQARAAAPFSDAKTPKESEAPKPAQAAKVEEVPLTVAPELMPVPAVMPEAAPVAQAAPEPSEEAPDFSAWLAPQPEVPLLPAPEEGAPEAEEQGYETVALYLPEQSADIFEASEVGEDAPKDDVDLESSLETEAPSTAPESDPGDADLEETEPEDVDLDLPASEDAEIESLPDDIEDEDSEEAITPTGEDEVEPERMPLLLGPSARIEDGSAPAVLVAERPMRPRPDFPELVDDQQDQDAPEAEQPRTSLLQKAGRGILALLPLPVAGIAAYFGTGPAADLINAAPRFDAIIGVVILLNVCWGLCEITGVAFKKNMALAARISFIITLYYPLDVLNRYLAGQTVDTSSLLYLLVPAVIGLTYVVVATRGK